MTTLIPLPQVMARTGLSRSGIYAATQTGTFPRSIQLSIRRVAWIESEIEDWINARIAESVSRQSINTVNAAKKIGVTHDELMQFINSGDLPSFHIGRHHLVKRLTLSAFQKQREKLLRNTGA